MKNKNNLESMISTVVILLMGALISTLMGCTTMRMQSECEKTNWQMLGENDGLEGLTESSLHTRQMIYQCNEVERPVDLQAIANGIKLGNAKYCSHSNAGAVGQNGKAYNEKVCELANAKNLIKAYKEGVEFFCKNRGYAAGFENQTVGAECPTHLASIFEMQFQKGKVDRLAKNVSALEVKIKEMEQQIDNLENENYKLKGENSSLESKNRDLESRVNSLSR